MRLGRPSVARLKKQVLYMEITTNDIIREEKVSGILKRSVNSRGREGRVIMRSVNCDTILRLLKISHVIIMRNNVEKSALLWVS